MARGKKENKPKLRIIPLGGLGEVGKNMTVYEYMDDIVVVDVGSIFPRTICLGWICGAGYHLSRKNADRIRGFVITHGHEDHIGACALYVQQRHRSGVWHAAHVGAAQP